MLGIVLAGGQSRRMGKDKALLKIAGQTLLERSCKLLTSAGCKQVVVSRNKTGFIADIYPDSGPLAGIHACIKKLSYHAESALILPVDMPVLNILSLKHLAREGNKARHSCHYAGSVFPLYLHDPLGKLPSLEHCLSQQKLAVQHWLKMDQSLVLENLSQNQLFNANTPSQWRQCQHHFLLS